MISHLPVSLTAGLAVALAMTTTGAAPVAAATPPLDTLEVAAAASGRTFGTALNLGKLTDSGYSSIVQREFGSVTPEGLTEIGVLQPSPGEFRFTLADQVVQYAASHGKRVRATGLIWHSVLPGWFANISTGERLRAAMNTHIATVLRHYAGRITTWDVVAEAYADDGTGRRRDSILQRTIGPTFVEEAFTTARAADPRAKLCYSDYGIEDLSKPKTQGVYAMVRDLKARGVPIDCVAMESHFNTVSYASTPVPDTFQQTIEAFAALGVDVHLSELDVAALPERQPAEYRKAVEACLAVPRCTSITVWGVRDSESWLANYNPLLFDRSGNKKPAYVAVLDALRNAPTRVDSTVYRGPTTD